MKKKSISVVTTLIISIHCTGDIVSAAEAFAVLLKSSEPLWKESSSLLSSLSCPSYVYPHMKRVNAYYRRRNSVRRVKLHVNTEWHCAWSLHWKSFFPRLWSSGCRIGTVNRRMDARTQTHRPRIDRGHCIFAWQRFWLLWRGLTPREMEKVLWAAGNTDATCDTCAGRCGVLFPGLPPGEVGGHKTDGSDWPSHIKVSSSLNAHPTFSMCQCHQLGGGELEHVAMIWARSSFMCWWG